MTVDGSGGSGNTHKRDVGCRLIALCSDSPTFDLNMMSRIISSAMMIALAPKGKTAAAAAAATSFSPSGVAAAELEDEDGSGDAESRHVKAVMEALQVAAHCPSAVAAGTGSGMVDGPPVGKGSKRGGKAAKGGKKGASAAGVGGGGGGGKAPGGTAAGMESRFTAAAASADRTQRTRFEWYSLVQNPQWHAPLALIHQLPDLERHEDESGSLVSPAQKGSSSDFLSVLQRAAHIIASELRRSNTNTSPVAGAGAESPTTTHCGQRCQEVNEVVLVITLQDPRLLQSLLNRRRTPTTSLVDTRLIVNFVDDRPPQSVNVQSSTLPSGAQGTRMRTSASSRRAQARETTTSPPTDTRDAESVNTSTAGSNTFSECIDRLQREGQITVVTSPAVVPRAYGPVCLREVFESGGDDRSLWVQRCVKSVLPGVQNVLRDVGRYAEWFSPKKVQYIPFNTTLRQQEDTAFARELPNASSGSLQHRVTSATPFVSSSVFATTPAAAAAVHQTDGREASVGASSHELPQSPSLILPVHRFEETWSHYIRERKVYGQWTCLSAARALASQVTVTLARCQQPKMVHLVSENSPSLRVLPSQPSDPRLYPASKNEIPASLLLQLRNYSSRRSILTLNDMGNCSRSYSTASALDSSKLGVGSPLGQVGRRPQSAPQAPSFTTTTARADEVYNFKETAARMPVDHTMDRPTALPDQEEVRWLAQQFVKKGLGAFVLPRGAAMDTGAIEDTTVTAPLPLSDEDSLAVLRIQDLLEEPLNGLSVEDAEAAVNGQILQHIESLFLHAEKKIPCGLLSMENASAGAHARPPELEEKLQRSIERNLTPRERRHILQLFFLEWMAELACINGTPSSTGKSPLKRRKKHSSVQAATGTGFGVFPPRLIEEYMSATAATWRMYEFQSRFGSHLTCLVHHTMPHLLEAVKGTLTAMHSTLAENIHPPNRALRIMAGGVPIPAERHRHLLWCHYVCGVPSLDQFNELVASEGAIKPNSSPASVPCSSFTSHGGGASVPSSSTDSTRYGGSIGDFVRRRLLQNLCNSSQLLVPTAAEAGGAGKMWCTEGNVQTVLEGRHALYPHNDGVVEVVTTERSRVCRYVKTTEVSCALQYTIPPPFSVAAASRLSTPEALRRKQQQQQQQQQQQEDVHFTAAFDDGVMFTCTRRVPSPAGTVKHTACSVEGEKSGAVSTRSLISRRSKSPSRQTHLVGNAGRNRRTRSPGVGDEVSGGRTHRGLKHKVGRSHEGGGEVQSEVSFSGEKVPRPFPVAGDGSVLLWTATESATTPDAAPSTATPGVIFPLAATLAVNGVTVHAEERDGQLWFMQHGSSNHPGPELLRCLHTCGADETWQRSMEVEVRRVVLLDAGIVCRYFHSGATQTLFPDGAVLTRYPSPIKSSSGSSGSNNTGFRRTQLFCETLLTAAGKCCVREIAGESVSKFRHISANAVQARVMQDRGHRCRILSRADGVTVIHYYLVDQENNGRRRRRQGDAKCKEGNNSKTKRNIDAKEGSGGANPDGGLSGEKGSDPGAWDECGSVASRTDVIARVTLHADGTCITSFSDGAVIQGYAHAPAHLQPLLEHAGMVTTTCSAAVRYCVEAPSLPRVFLCAADDCYGNSIVTGDGEKEGEKQQRQQQQQQAVSSSSAVPQPGAPLLPPVEPFSSASGTDAREEESLRRRKPHDCFYISFGDGSVLQRRVVRFGAGDGVILFLETLLTRPTDTSIRVLHESNLVTVEPADAVRRNMKTPSSLAIGEGFAMFDLALGGMRLVDYQHYLTEVQQLYSPGPVHARITPSTLESLLRQLVLPTYTPHTVTKARKEALLGEEISANTQYRRDHTAGICPPLVNRLRILAEGFIIAHNLLRIDVLNTAKHQWESSRYTGTDGKVTHVAATPAFGWGNAVTLAGDHMSAAKKKLSLVSPSEQPSIAPPPMGVVPIFFAELEDGIVVQYLHWRDVEEYMQAREAEPFPIYLSSSTASGEPGIQQLTFFRVRATAAACTMSTMGRKYSPNFSSAASLASLRGPLARESSRGGASANGSFFRTALQRREQLSLVLGKQASFPTTQWLPPTMQLPRRFLGPHSTSRRSREENGVTVIDDPVMKSSGGAPSSSHCEQLRVFLKFSNTTQEVQQLTLFTEAQRYRQLTSLIT